MLTSKQIRGVRVRKHNKRKAGKIKEVLFAPETQQVVGYIVSRPDFLLMVKRKDKFLAFDEITIDENCIIAGDGKGVWEESALKRIGYSYDDVVVWRNMPVMTEDGREIGRISDLAYDEKTGKLLAVRLSDGALATALLGRKDIPSDLIVRCDRNGVVVKNPAVAVEASGGAVDAAAQATAIATDRISRGAKTATKAATNAASTISKRTSGMFSAFKEEYQKALTEDDDEE